MYLLPASRQLLLIAVLIVAGCSGDPNKPYPVRGVVVYEDGKPATELARGSVTFTLPTDAGQVLSSGTIADDGSFILSYKKEGDGAIAGNHRVVIEPPGIEGQEDDPKLRRPRAVIDPASTVQEVTVEPKNNNITLTVKRATRTGRTR